MIIKEKFNIRFDVRLNESLKLRLDEKAKKKNISSAELIRQWIKK